MSFYSVLLQIITLLSVNNAPSRKLHSQANIDSVKDAITLTFATGDIIVLNCSRDLEYSQKNVQNPSESKWLYSTFKLCYSAMF